tara:strand:- start:210 stop:875 length:666 start_codon:yes stop_codon:yes gene_type:complete
MSNVPAKIEKTQSLIPVEAQKEMVDGGFLPRIQLLQPLSKVVTEWDSRNEGEKPEAGLFWFGDTETGVPLEKTFNCVPCNLRMHALLISEGKVGAESFEYGSKEFERIKLASRRKKEGEFARWGVDALLYVPGHGFGVYFMCGRAQPTGSALQSYLGEHTTFSSTRIKTKKFSWWEPEVFKNVSDPPAISQLELDAAMQQFNSKTQAKAAEPEGELLDKER